MGILVLIILFICQPLTWAFLAIMIGLAWKIWVHSKRMVVGEVYYYSNKSGNLFVQPPLVKVKVLKRMGKYVKYQYEWGGETEVLSVSDFKESFTKHDKSGTFRVFKKIEDGERIYK